MDLPCTCLTLISKAPLLYFMKHYSVKMHAFLGNANAPRIGGHGSEVLLFTMQPLVKLNHLRTLPSTMPISVWAD
jgi:hypothetical protein